MAEGGEVVYGFLAGVALAISGLRWRLARFVHVRHPVSHERPTFGVGGRISFKTFGARVQRVKEALLLLATEDTVLTSHAFLHSSSDL